FQVVIASFFIVIAVYDLKHFLILDKVILPGIVIATIYAIYQSFGNPCGSFFCFPIISGGIGAMIISGFFLLQYLVSKGKWMGFGDVKFGLLLGMVAGFPLSLVLLFMAYISGAVIGLLLISLSKKEMTSKLPFGTFLSVAAIMTMIYGSQILNWYLNLIGL
ncbi:MAG: A24 family peptidase, partial [Candidatus Doudnabacteria bacterium]|nr:A24 family peptidase [Candidatus Doudnabacteria bacterium]